MELETLYVERGRDRYGIMSEPTQPPVPVACSILSQSEYTRPPSDYGNACVAYAEQEPVRIYEDCSPKGCVSYELDTEYENSFAYDDNICNAHVAYAEHESDIYNVSKECGEYEDRSKYGSLDDNIYAYIAEYEEIDNEDNCSALEQCYVAIGDIDKDAHRQALVQRKTASPSCFAAILNPHQLLFGWKSKVPWACQTTLRTWSRVLSTRMGIQLSIATTGPTATATFLRRTLKDYNKRVPNAIQTHETLPSDLLLKIQAVFDMAKQKPTRYRHVIGISCFPIHMSMPKSLWKDIAVLTSLTEKAKKKTASDLVLATTDAAADRLGQLQEVVISFYAKRHGLQESSLKAVLIDTGPGFRNMHSSMLAMKALSCLTKRGQSILLPEPCHPTLSVWFNVFQYSTGVTPRYYRRDPNRSWMLDFGDLQEKIDDTTAAVFISNPSLMCGGISSYRELSIFVAMLQKRHIPVIVEETMDYLVYDQQQPSHSILELKPTIPVIVINSAYRWMVFGAQGPTVAWALVYDPESRLPNSLHDSLRVLQTKCLKMSSGLPPPSTLSTVLHYDGWVNDIVRYLAKNVAVAVGLLSQTPGLVVAPPKAGYFLVILIDYSSFPGKFCSDTEFSTALFSEESVKVVCGSVLVGWKDSFALEMYMRRDLLIEACDRIDQFCRRHATIGSLAVER